MDDKITQHMILHLYVVNIDTSLRSVMETKRE